MAAYKELVVKEEELCCYICLEVYDKPRTLPCLHSLCHTCLVRYVEKVWEVDKTVAILCPICRVNTPVSKCEAKNAEKWVQNLPINFTLVSILSSKKEKMSNADGKCVQCLKDNLDSEATVYCYECSEQLCDKCKEVHKKVTILSNHKLIDIKNRHDNVAKLELLKSLTRCPEHISEEVRYVCKDHDQLCCNECAIVTHRKCDQMVSISKELGKIGTSVKSASERLQVLDKYLDQLIEYELHHQSIIKTCRNEMKDKLRDIKKRIDNAFESLERSICAEFDGKSSSILKESGLQKEEIESLKSEVKQSTDKMQAANDLGQQLHLFVMQRVLSNEITQHEEEIRRLNNKMSKDVVKASENLTCANIEANIAGLLCITKKVSGENVPFCPVLKHKSFIDAVKCNLDVTSKHKEAENVYAEDSEEINYLSYDRELQNEEPEEDDKNEDTDHLSYDREFQKKDCGVKQNTEDYFQENDVFVWDINDKDEKLDFRSARKTGTAQKSFSTHTKVGGKAKHGKKK